MPKKTILITGSSGLVGSEAVLHFDRQGDNVIGLDNNMRKDFFGTGGDTSSTLEFLSKNTKNFRHIDLDIRDRVGLDTLVRSNRPSAIVHCAAQPSHDLAKTRSIDDFEVNALGTLNLLEAVRTHAPEAPFVLMSTNKVYGDAPNEIPFVEKETRFEFQNEDDFYGIDENCRIDRCLHSLFGASKLSADILTQEYGRYFGMPTVCFRAGCITGSRHQGVELHGFLQYLAKVISNEQHYRIFGYKGKQVRDQIHSEDLLSAIALFLENPRAGEVYNIGGGRESNASLLESIEMFERRLNKKISSEYVEEARVGDHICYISDTRKFKEHFPSWKIERGIESIVEELCSSLGHD